MSTVIEFDEFGGPEVLHPATTIDEAPGDGAIAVRVEAFAVNPLDAMMRSGTSPAPVPLPHARLGIEATGVVEAVGGGVRGSREGDPVIVTAIPDSAVNGAYAERLVVPADRVVPRPPGLTVEEAAAVWVGFSTAYGALVETAGMRPGDRVLVTAATGAVGRAALQVAAIVGADTIAVTRSAARVDELSAAGAGEVVATDREDLGEAVAHRTGGRGVDIVLDLVRGPGQRELIRMLRPAGTLVAAGYLDPRPTPAPGATTARALEHRGFAALLDPAIAGRTASFLTAGVARGGLRPSIDTVFPFDDVVGAHRRFDAGRHGGRKIVVRVP